MEADCAALEAKKAKLDAMYNEKSARVAGVLQLLDDLERSELEEGLEKQIEEAREPKVEVVAEPEEADDDAMDEDDDGEIKE